MKTGDLFQVRAFCKDDGYSSEMRARTLNRTLKSINIVQWKDKKTFYGDAIDIETDGHHCFHSVQIRRVK